MNRTATNENKKQILVVSACPSTAGRLTAMLDEADYEIDHCSDCETALNQIKKQPYVMALMNKDGQDPDIITTSSKLKQARPAFKILVVSGYAHRGDLKDAQASGIIDAFELKTARNEELLSVIANMLVPNEKPVKRTTNPATTKEPVRAQAIPDNSLLNDLEQRHPGILFGCWSAADKFTVKQRT